MSTNYISQITDTAGTTHDLMESVSTRIFRATCESSAADTEKVATLEDSTGYSLATGVKVAVYFKYGNSSLSPTLRVTNGSDAAHTIGYPDSVTGVTYGGTLASWGRHEVVIFVYDGSLWVCCGSALGIYKAYNLANSYKGTVTSVGLSNDTDGGLTITSSPVTSSGTIKIKHTNILSSAQTTSGIYPIKIDKNGHISEYGSAVTIPTKTSDLTNDSGFITGMTILSYGNSTWDDFIDAYNANKVVYCRASSNSNPASGTQGRLAFMAFVNNTNPTNVEFQYYHSVSSHSASQQGDQVFVYKLDKTSGWSVTTREASSKVSANNGLTTSYSSDTVTVSHANTAITAQTTQAVYPITFDAYGHITGYGSAAVMPTKTSDLTNDSNFATIQIVRW